MFFRDPPGCVAEEQIFQTTIILAIRQQRGRGLAEGFERFGEADFRSEPLPLGRQKGANAYYRFVTVLPLLCAPK